MTAERAYLATGAIAPLAGPVRRAAESWLERSSNRPLDNFAAWQAEAERLRRSFATLIGASPAEVAITDNTSRAANVAVSVLGSLHGRKVLVDPTTYPSSLFPWLSKTDKEVVASAVELTPQAVAQHGRDVAAVVISHVAWQTGFRHDLRGLSQAAHEQGAVLMVDGAQSVGAVPADVQADGVDVLVTTAMKWLFGIPGVGFAYVSPQLLEGRASQDVGYVGVEWSGGWEAWPVAQTPRLPDGARRFELGVPALPSVAAATAGIDLVQSVGLDRLSSHIESLASLCIDGLARLGQRVLTPLQPERRAGVIVVRHPQAEDAAADLSLRGVDVWSSAGMGIIRIDPAGFSNDDDLMRLLDAARAWPAPEPSRTA